MKHDNFVKKLKVEGTKHIDILYFNKESFLKCKCGTEEDFYNTISPTDIAYQYFQDLENSLETISFQMIDDEYFSYLKENKLEDDEQSRVDYCSYCSKEDKQRLWEKHEYDEGYDYGVLPLVIIEQEEKSRTSVTNYILDNDTINKLKNVLIDNFNNCKESNFNLNIQDIYISPYILNMSQLLTPEVEEFMVENGLSELSNNNVNIDPSVSYQLYPNDTPFCFIGIFFMYKYKVPATIDKEYIEHLIDNNIDIPDIDTKIIETILKQVIKKPFETMTSCLIYIESFEEILKGYIEFVANTIDKQVDQLNKMNDISTKHTKKRKKRNLDF